MEHRFLYKDRNIFFQIICFRNLCHEIKFSVNQVIQILSTLCHDDTVPIATIPFAIGMCFWERAINF